MENSVPVEQIVFSVILWAGYMRRVLPGLPGDAWVWAVTGVLLAILLSAAAPPGSAALALACFTVAGRAGPDG